MAAKSNFESYAKRLGVINTAILPLPNNPLHNEYLALTSNLKVFDTATLILLLDKKYYHGQMIELDRNNQEAEVANWTKKLNPKRLEKMKVVDKKINKIWNERSNADPAFKDLNVKDA
ncbi:MAG: hypothetical protein N2484_03210 [Clostridia bacterium]|nr:hypothetical protein [Clostridia bacterium]